MYTNKPLLIVGASGHGKVVLDAILKTDIDLKYINILDDNIALDGKLFMDFVIKAPSLPFLEKNNFFHVAIGDNCIREKVYNFCISRMCTPYTVFHPRAIKPIKLVELSGCFVAANSVIGPDVEVGAGVIINHSAVVDHDCKLGDFVHIAPSATLSGGVTIGSRALVGVGAKVVQGVNIGKDVVVGAGAVVIKDVPDGEVVIGIPAKKYGKKCD